MWSVVNENEEIKSRKTQKDYSDHAPDTKTLTEALTMGIFISYATHFLSPRAIFL